MFYNVDMGIIRKFSDGITSLSQKLANRRNAQANNLITHQRVSHQELRAIYRTGIGSKIVRLKTGLALNDTLQFDNEADEQFFNARLLPRLKLASKFMLAFGRALIVIHEPGADLGRPPEKINDWSKVRYHVFSGDMVYVQSVDLDLNSPNYLKPKLYSVRGHTIHPSRVVDMKYVEPVEMEAPEYFYGGISEFELIRDELVSDQVIQRAVPAMLEKSSTLFYKVNGFKELLQDRQEQDIVTYFTELENLRSIYGAGIVDKDDETETKDQSLANLSDSDMITLR